MNVYNLAVSLAIVKERWIETVNNAQIWKCEYA